MITSVIVIQGPVRKTPPKGAAIKSWEEKPEAGRQQHSIMEDWSGLQPTKPDNSHLTDKCLPGETLQVPVVGDGEGGREGRI